MYALNPPWSDTPRASDEMLEYRGCGRMWWLSLRMWSDCREKWSIVALVCSRSTPRTGCTAYTAAVHCTVSTLVSWKFVIFQGFFFVIFFVFSVYSGYMHRSKYSCHWVPFRWSSLYSVLWSVYALNGHLYSVLIQLCSLVVVAVSTQQFSVSEPHCKFNPFSSSLYNWL